MDEMPSLSPVDPAEGEWLRSVATTRIVADVVRNAGGDQIELTTLLPLGADPHASEPTPRDVAAVADAHVGFANGVELELFHERLLESAEEGRDVVPVSHGVELLAFAEEGSHGHEDEHSGGADPHRWQDPNNALSNSQYGPLAGEVRRH